MHADIFIAVLLGDLESVKLLLPKFANAKDKHGRLALHIATIQDRLNFDIIHMLVENGTDVNSKDKSENTPLMNLCRHESGKSYDAVRYLAENNADVNITDHDGNTALYFACHDWGSHSGKIVKYLLKHGADINVEHGADPTLASYLHTSFLERDDIVLHDGTPHRQVLSSLRQEYPEKQLPICSPDLPDRAW